MEKLNNLYTSELPTREEQHRLKEWNDYPLIASIEAMEKSLQGKVVLDLGAGPNTSLGRWVTSNGGRYIAFDIQTISLADQAASGHAALQGDILNSPFKPYSVDITHARLVLMHLAQTSLGQVVRESVRTAKLRAIFIEPNWRTFSGSTSVNRFRDFALKVLGRRCDLFLGENLEIVIRQALPATGMRISRKRVVRQPTTDYTELLNMIHSLMASGDVKGSEELTQQAEEIAASLGREVNNDKRPAFVLPEFVSVCVDVD
jgi:hypothetical protein